MTEAKNEPPKVPTFEELWKQYLDYLPKAVNESGIYPLPAMYYGKTDKGETGIVIGAICGTELMLPFATKAIAERDAKMLIFGLDRTTKPNQGTEFADCFTVFGWDGRKWITGVLNYQHEPRIVREIDMKNTFWNEMMARELRASGLVQLTESPVGV